MRSLKIQEGAYSYVYTFLRSIIAEGLLVQSSSIMAFFSLLYHAGIFISESVIFILPAEVRSEIDFNF